MHTGFEHQILCILYKTERVRVGDELSETQQEIESWGWGDLMYSDQVLLFCFGLLSFFFPQGYGSMCQNNSFIYYLPFLRWQVIRVQLRPLFLYTLFVTPRGICKHSYLLLGIYWGAGIVQWLERRTRDQKVAGSNPCWSGGRILSTFCADSYFGIRSTPMLPQ